MWIYKHNSETFKSIIPSFPLFPRNNNGIETEEIERKELIERLNYYNCGQIRAEHFRERHRDSRSFLLKRPFLSLSLPSREFSEADIIGFVTVLSANRPILRCILLGINLPFCFWVTAFGRFSGETGVLIANTKPLRRTWIDTSSSGPGLDRPLREKTSLETTETGKWYRFSANFLPLDGIESEFFSLPSPPLPLRRVAREIKIEVAREARVRDRWQDRGREKEVWSEWRSRLLDVFELGEFARGYCLCNDFSD